jgi:DNA-binding IclR family transcriptional regulator
LSKPKPWSAHPMLQDFGAAPDAVKSAARALRILEFFDEIRRPARANEIAGCLDFPQSSTSVLLTSLVRLGFLDYDMGSKSYLPSLRVAVLATWRDTGYFRDGSVLTLLETLADRSGLAACLTTRAGIFVRYLNVVQHPRPGDVHITLTARRYAVRSASGIVLLTGMNDSDIRMLVHQTRAQADPVVSAVAFGDVIKSVQAAREDGHFVSYGLVSEHSGAIAVALPEAVTGGWQHMALSLAGRLDHVKRDTDVLVAELKEAVAHLVRRDAGQSNFQRQVSGSRS